MSADISVLRGPEELTAQWLAAALGCGTISDFGVEPIGTLGNE